MKQINIFGMIALLMISFALALVVITNFVVRLNLPSMEQKYIEDKTILDKSEFPADIVDDDVVYDSVVKESKKDISFEEIPPSAPKEPLEIAEEQSKPYYPQEDFQYEPPQMMEEAKVEKEKFVAQEATEKAISDVKAVPGSISIPQTTVPLGQKATALLPPPSGSSVPAPNAADKDRGSNANSTAGRMTTPGPPPSATAKTPGSKLGSSPSTLPQFDSQFTKAGPVK